MKEELIQRMQEPYPVEDTVHIFHPLFKEWFFSKFKALSEPQKYSIINIHSRINTLVSSPTGSGKTLSAFGAILNNLIDHADKGTLKDKVYAIYVSPLRALSNDVHKNLIAPLKEINALAKEKGMEHIDIRVAVRTGDTTPKEKAHMLKNPPHILITTPESLSILLSSKKFRDHLDDVEWCIVDEIHALASNKRGVHLSLTLELLSHIATHMCRVGLSATVAPLEEVAQFLVGPTRRCKIIDVQYLKKLDLEVICPVKDLIEQDFYDKQSALYHAIDYLVDQHKTTLIFTNTRAGTERVIHYLKTLFPSRYGEHNTGAHHGSLTREQRHDVENRLKDGKMKVVACSTTLELGIDIGYVDLVLCINSPKSVARALQRIGRSGHALHETTKGKIIVTDRDALVETAVLAKLANERTIDRIRIPTQCLDVLAQQIIGFTLEQVWQEKELYDLIKQSYCYAEMDYSSYLEVLDYLGGQIVLPNWNIIPKVWRKEGALGKRGKMGRVIYMTNIGTIPDSSFIQVKIGPQIVGKIDEGFLERLKPGDIFVLGGSTYQFKHARGMTAQVVSAVAKKPTVPQWASEALPLTYDLAAAVTKFRGLMFERFCGQTAPDDHTSFVKDYLGCNDNVAKKIYKYFSEQYRFCKKFSTPSKLVVEYFEGDDEAMVIFHSLYGRPVNACLARAVKFAIEKMYKKQVDIGISDHGFTVLSQRGVNIRRAFEILKADKMDLLMHAALETSEVYRRRFRNCAVRSLMILKNYKGVRKLAGRQQVSSMILRKALFEVNPDFFLLREARREVLQDLMDFEKTKDVLRSIEEGKIEIDEFHTRIPSPFAFNLALQSSLDLLNASERHEFIKYNHQNVLAKISLNEGKAAKH